MDAAVVLNVLIDLVGDHRDGSVPGDSGQFVEVGRRRDGAGRVLRVVDDDEARALAEHTSYAIPVEAEMRRLEGNVDATPAGEPDGGVVGVIGGVEDDGFIASAHHCLDGG